MLLLDTDAKVMPVRRYSIAVQPNYFLLVVHTCIPLLLLVESFRGPVCVSEVRTVNF